jgi:thioesterase domain-containing protein
MFGPAWRGRKAAGQPDPGQGHGDAPSVDMHSRDLIKEGLAVEKLVLVQAWREAGSLFDTRERSALAWAETVTRVADTAVPDFKAASAVFSEKELADLTIAIGLMNAYNRLAIGFRVPPKAALAEQQDQIVATNTASLDTRMSAQLGEQ